jgi:hypothetical protein
LKLDGESIELAKELVELGWSKLCILYVSEILGLVQF